MAGPLYTTLEDIAAAIAADAGINSAADPQTDFTTCGAIKAARREGPPSVDWVVTGAKWEPPGQDESETERACNQRVVRAEVTFLGADYDACTKLVKDFGAAVFRTQARTTCRVVDEEHVRQAVASSARYQITLAVDFDDPVIFETSEVADVEATAQTGTVAETE